MSTPVLVAIVLLAITCAAALTRLRLADRRSVAAHHRALETMGRLVAQHPPVEAAPGPEPHAGQAHVRVVAGTEPVVPPHLPPRRARRGSGPIEYQSWEDVAPLEAAPVRAELAPAQPAQPAETVTAASSASPVLHFDALAADEGSTAGRVAPPAGRHWRRSRRATRPPIRRRRRQSRQALRRTAVGVLVVAVLAAGTIGGLLVSRAHPAPAPAPPPRAARAAPPTTTATTRPAPAAPVLVSSGAGYSEYRLSGPATIVLTASGRCWVEIRQSGPSGPVLYEGNLVAGDTRGTPRSTWVRLGNPSNVTVRVNGVAISPPSLIAGEPYNLQFD